MKYWYLMILLPFIGSGCQTTQLQQSTLHQAKSVTDLYYQQVLTNIAMLHGHPASLPYYSLPVSGQDVTQFSVSLSYTAGWDIITSATKLLDRYLLDKQTAAVTGGDTNIQTWNTDPTNDPNKLLLMKYAYEVAFGNSAHFGDLVKVLDYDFQLQQEKQGITNRLQKEKQAINNKTNNDLLIALQSDDEKVQKAANEKLNKAIQDYLERSKQPSITQFAVQYSTMLHSGWFGIGTRHDIPKEACYVGHCGNTYAWVLPGHEEELAEFTLVILDIVTFVAPDRQPRPGTAPSTGKVAR